MQPFNVKKGTVHCKSIICISGSMETEIKNTTFTPLEEQELRMIYT